MRVLAFLILSVWCVGAAAETRPCGADAACEIEGGSYHLMFPEDWDGVSALPALIWFHGHRSSGAAIFRGGGLKSSFAGAGWLVIALNGQRSEQGDFLYWPGVLARGGRDDVGFAAAALADAAARARIDPLRVYVGGFSAGASMVWLLACMEGERYAGYVAVAGALRRPSPEGGCPGGAFDLLQVHGYADRVVPLEGRELGDWHQGDVFESLALARAADGCVSAPDRVEIGARFWRREWRSCPFGALALDMHAGGHGLPPGWAARARDWFDARSAAE